MVPGVTDVLVHPSSVVTVFCDGVFRFALIGNLWNRSPFSFTQKRAHSWTVTQGEMRFDGSQVKASPLSRTL